MISINDPAFRRACDKMLREAITNFAADSHHGSPLGAAIYDHHRAQHKSYQHAVRILARARIRVIWRCCQNDAAYQPTRHGGAQRQISTAA